VRHVSRDAKGGVYSSNLHERWHNNIVLPDRIHNVEQEPAGYCGMMVPAEYPDQNPWPALYKARKLSMIEVFVYTTSNWTDPELHLPGSIVAFNEMSSKYKWLEMHTGNHLGAFYEQDRVDSQTQFLDYFLKDKHDNGMRDVPQSQLVVRPSQGEPFWRTEKAFPVPDATETELYFTSDEKLSTYTPSGQAKAYEYEGLKGRVTFTAEPVSSAL